jgi:hypothetical protein
MMFSRSLNVSELETLKFEFEFEFESLSSSFFLLRDSRLVYTCYYTGTSYSDIYPEQLETISCQPHEVLLCKRFAVASRKGRSESILHPHCSSTHYLQYVHDQHFRDMEKFFAPTRRLQDLLPADDVDFEYKEVELVVPTQDFLSHHWGWKNLLAFFMSGEMPTIAWITEDCFLWVKDAHSSNMFCRLELGMSAKLTTTSGAKQTLFLVKRPNSLASPSPGAFSIFWHALTTSNCVALKLATGGFSFELCPGPALSHFFSASPWLQDLQFRGFVFDEDHCRALATLERTDLQVKFQDYTFNTQDAEATFNEWLRHGKVVTELIECPMKSSVLTALSGNSSVQSLSLCLDTLCLNICEGHFRSLSQALPGNKGIVNLRLSWSTDLLMTNELWSFFFRSLWTHPRIESLSLSDDESQWWLSDESKTTRLHALLQMVQCNTVMRRIDLPDTMKVLEIYQNSILPRLEMNRSFFEEQRRAIQQADPSVCGKLLGRALHAVRYNPNLIFRFLSDNVPAFVRTEEDVSVVPLEQDPVVVSVSGQKRNTPS